MSYSFFFKGLPSISYSLFDHACMHDNCDGKLFIVEFTQFSKKKNNSGNQHRNE